MVASINRLGIQNQAQQTQDYGQQGNGLPGAPASTAPGGSGLASAGTSHDTFGYGALTPAVQAAQQERRSVTQMADPGAMATLHGVAASAPGGISRSVSPDGSTTSVVFSAASFAQVQKELPELGKTVSGMGVHLPPNGDWTGVYSTTMTPNGMSRSFAALSPSGSLGVGKARTGAYEVSDTVSLNARTMSETEAKGTAYTSGNVDVTATSSSPMAGAAKVGLHEHGDGTGTMNYHGVGSDGSRVDGQMGHDAAGDATANTRFATSNGQRTAYTQSRLADGTTSVQRQTFQAGSQGGSVAGGVPGSGGGAGIGPGVGHSVAAQPNLSPGAAVSPGAAGSPGAHAVSPTGVAGAAAAPAVVAGAAAGPTATTAASTTTTVPPPSPAGTSVPSTVTPAPPPAPGRVPRPQPVPGQGPLPATTAPAIHPTAVQDPRTGALTTTFDASTWKSALASNPGLAAAFASLGPDLHLGTGWTGSYTSGSQQNGAITYGALKLSDPSGGLGYGGAPTGMTTITSSHISTPSATTFRNSFAFVDGEHRTTAATFDPATGRQLQSRAAALHNDGTGSYNASRHGIGAEAEVAGSFDRLGDHERTGYAQGPGGFRGYDTSATGGGLAAFDDLRVGADGQGSVAQGRNGAVRRRRFSVDETT